MRKQGIDVSYVQGAIDWSAVTADFAMIRACYGWDNDRQIDSRLYENARGAKENGTPYGLFHYSYARTPDDALKEADFFLRVIKGLSRSRSAGHAAASAMRAWSRRSNWRLLTRFCSASNRPVTLRQSICLPPL